MFEETLIECPIGHARMFRQHYNGKSRLLRQISEDTIKKSGWVEPEEPLPDGVYCDKCNNGLRLELDNDDLISFGIDDLPLTVPEAQHAASRVADQVHRIIGDAAYAVHTEPARAAVFGPEPGGIHPRVRLCFPASLYSHQSEAITAALTGRDVVQTTGTGSGKSVGLWAPVLSVLATDSDATAIAVFPRIALGNDQVDNLASLSEAPVADVSLFTLTLGADLAPIEVGVMNHTTKQLHPQILKKARLIITTPDQLHFRILPAMKRSSEFVKRLRFVVLDEIHTYTGQDGSTMASLLTRLQVDCLHASGATPQFLMSSASLANVEDFTSSLTGQPDVVVISEDGSPKHEFTTFVIEADHRTFLPSLHTEIARGFEGAPPTGLTFVQSKEGVRTLAEVTRQALEAAGLRSAAQSVIAYSAQDDAGSRLDKEGRIAEDEARFVLTTSALELGVDFTNVHYSITTEYSGLVMETRQRLGRAGRRHAGTGIVLLEDRKQPSWPTTPAGALETIRFAPATIQPPVMTASDRLNILVMGLAHDLDELDLDLVRRVDPVLVDDILKSEYWETSPHNTASQRCFDQLAPFRGATQKGTVLSSRGNRIVAIWSGSELVKQAWCGNRLTNEDGRQLEVVSVKPKPYGNGEWEIRVEAAEDFFEVESSVFSKVVDETRLSSEHLGRLTLTRSEGRLKHSLSSSRRRQPGGEWAPHLSTRRINQTTSERTAVTSIFFANGEDHVLADTVRFLIVACLDAIGVSQYDIWSTSDSGRILFYDPQGRTSPIAWSIIDRLAELMRIAGERIDQFGRLVADGRIIEREELTKALQLITNDTMPKAA